MTGLISLIVDGSNLAHRCRHTFNLSYRDIDVSVTYGFLRLLHTTMLQHVPNIVIVCWDGGVPEHRRENCPTYKQKERELDEDYESFLEQVIELQDVLPYFGVTSVRKVGCEADDLLYHAACLLGGKKVILTTDQDLYQAVVDDISGDTVAHSPTKDIIVSRSNFEEITGVIPGWQTWMSYRALVGDSSDNIPGVKGIGPKRALALLKEYGGSVTAMVNAALGKGESLMKLSEAVIKSLSDFGVNGFMKSFATMRLDRDLCGARMELLREFEQWQPYNHKEVRSFLIDYAFVHLQEPEFYDSFRSLESPKFGIYEDTLKELRVPLISPVRRPVEVESVRVD